MSLKAAIDIGSNSVLLLIAEISNNNIKTLESCSTITSLGRELDKNGKFHPESMDDTRATLKNYRDIAIKYNIEPENIIITATEASRVADNALDFYQSIYEELDLKVNIITGVAEAYFSTMGVTGDPSITDEDIILMDIGGASTEFIHFNTKSQKILNSVSTPVGVVRATEWAQNHELNEVFDEKLQNFQAELEEYKTSKLICVAGTMTSIANMYLNNKTFEEKNISGMKLKFEDLTQLISNFGTKTDQELLELFPFLGKRSKTIKAGMSLSKYLCQKLGVKQLHISTYGLRHGTILVDSIKPEFLYHGTN